MKVFFTADYHLDHANIILYSNRPFIKYGYISLGNLYLGDINPFNGDWLCESIKKSREQEMNLTLVKNHNRKVEEGDLVYHIGDFCFKGVGNARHWEQQLNGTIVHIRGNHDKNNGIKTYITHAIMEWGGMIFYVTHEPPEENQMETLESHIISMCDFIICGHVHDLWKHKLIEVWNSGCRVEKIAINVGVDVWGFEPISIHSILKLIAKIKKGYYKED